MNQCNSERVVDIQVRLCNTPHMYLVLQFILYEAEKYFYIGLTLIGK